MEASGTTLGPCRMSPSLGTLLLMLNCLAAMANPLRAQGSWTVTANGGPASRSAHAMAYDSINQRVILFGGALTSGGFSSETWAFSAGSWSLIANTGPSPRHSTAMAYDSVRGRVVLFGGNDGAPRADTWELVGNNWVPHVLAGGPYPRFSHAMAFDSVRGRTVLFGGHLHGLIETWEWDGTQWSPYWGAGPGGRDSHAMAFDSLRGRVLLFGGNNGTVLMNFLNDSWEWDGTSWTQVATVGPPGMNYCAMAFDSQRGRCVLTGGFNGSVNATDWEWDGSTWAPGYRATLLHNYGHAVAYDAGRGRMVAFGGQLNPSQATRELVFTIGGGTTFGSGCGSPTLSLVPDPAMPPRIDATGRAVVGSMPTPVGAMMVGWSNAYFGAFTLPVSLASLGMTGCDLLQSADLVGLPVAPTGMATGEFVLYVPNQPAAIGLHLYLQAFAFAPTANQGGFVVSNGLDWTVGP